MGIRIYQLAKELHIPSTELINKLRALKVEVKSHMSVLNDEVAQLIKEEFAAKVKKEVPLKTKCEKKKAPSLKTALREEPVKEIKRIEIKFPFTVKDLAIKLSLKPSEIMPLLIKEGILVNINQEIPQEMVTKLGEILGCEIVRFPTEEEKIFAEHFRPPEDKEGKPRPPVVTLMGHVDHGKTSLLDVIRKSNLAEKEAGGITQHIGAYAIEFRGKKITFLDTPGHEAFTAMRARGANVTDIVILVVAADDGVMPQTIEAIDHARAAKVPIVVAINKIDKSQADIERVKRQLQGLNLIPEEWGGKTIMVGVSAKTGQGIDELLEMVLLEAELLELKADPYAPARGVVLESKVSRGGPRASLLVQNGTLFEGDIILVGGYWGRIKAMFNDRLRRIKEAPPSLPVEVLGLSGTPEAGEKFFVVKNETLAKEIAERRQSLIREKGLLKPQKVSLEDLHKKIEAGEKELRIILKADVQGSLEAVKTVLARIPTQEVELNILHTGIGDISESDIMLASASDAVVFGFHVGIDSRASGRAKIEGVEVRIYQIIYEVYEEIKKAIEGMLTPQFREVSLGRAEVKKIFEVSKV
ncbi:MAG: translation initiation factor IF-2, partial [Candidatus Omnitrophota bacterium]